MGIKKKHVPGCKCCGGVPCNACQSGTVPTSWEVTIAGVSASTFCDLSICGLLNETFVIESKLSAYVWEEEYPDITCEGRIIAIRVSVGCSAGLLPRIVVYVFARGGFGDFVLAEWDKVEVDPIDCAAVDEDFTAVTRTSGTMCDFSAATCHLTAVP